MAGKQSLVLVGADRHCLAAAEDLGVDVTVVYGASANDFGLPPIPLAFRQVPVDDQTDLECVLAGLTRAGIRAGGITAVYTNDEASLVTASALGALLHAEVLPPETAVRFRDKAVQKQAVQAAGVPTARFEVIDDVRALTPDHELAFRPAVLKPIAGAGTGATFRIEDAEGLGRACRRLQDAGSRARQFLVEEFVPGDEWLVDGVVRAGRVAFTSVARYGVPNLAVVVDHGLKTSRRFDPVAESWAFARCAPVVEAALRALGLRSGVFHMELFHDPVRDSLTFGECAARRGGSLIQEEVAAKFGVSLAQCAIQCALGREPDVAAKITDGTVGSTFLPTVPGTLLSRPSAADLSRLPNVEFAKVELPAGFRMPAAAPNTVAKVGQVMLRTTSPERLAARIDEVVDWFHERMVVARPGATTAELRALED